MRAHISCQSVRFGSPLVWWAMVVWAITATRAHGQKATGSDAVATRIVHTFDFDERASGNLEDVPKFWEPLSMKEFPRFSRGGFDFQKGHNAPPSFYLASQGRSVAYHYTGSETRIRSNSDYRVVGFIRPDRLPYARACLSAFFLDQEGQPILDTLVRSRYVGGSDDGKTWSPVELFLPAAPRRARFIGLAAWVMQSGVWDTSLPQRRPIARVDVHGGAWFDDITIFALPQVEIRTTAPGNVVTSHGPQELQVLVADQEGIGLTARLTVDGAQGQQVEDQPVPVVVGKAAKPWTMPLAPLAPGLYRAQVKVFVHDTPIVTRRLTFARVSPIAGNPKAEARSFGVVIGPKSRSDSQSELSLLLALGTRSVKLPVWTGRPDDPPSPSEKRTMDEFLQRLLQKGFVLTGVFFGPPAAIVRKDGPYPRPLLELLSGPPAAWKEHLAMVAAPYASTFQSWQLGPDGKEELAGPEQIQKAITQFREAMRPFMTDPQLVWPATQATQPPPDKGSINQLSLALSEAFQPAQSATPIQHFKEQGYESVTAFMDRLSAGRYQRIPRLADWARRMISARHSGFDVVFMPQPWHVRKTVKGLVTEPTEEFVMLRTLATVLSDAEAGPHTHVAPNVRCLAFYRGDSSVLAMWDPQAPRGGSTYPVQLGNATQQIDLWGRTSPLKRNPQGRQMVRLTALPVLIDKVDRWLIDFRSSLSLQPTHVQSGTELVTHVLEIPNRTGRLIAGTIQCQVPPSWEVSPGRIDFNLMPQRTKKVNVTIRYPHNESAGVKTLLAEITTTDGHYLEVPLSVTIGLKDIEVSAMAVVQRGDLLIRQVITNRSKKVVHFRGSALVPGRQRQYRPITNLGSGKTKTAEYRFARGEPLIGSSVRVELREMNDGPRTHSLLLRVP